MKTRLVLLFHPSGGSTLSEDRSGVGDLLKMGVASFFRRLEVPDVELYTAPITSGGGGS